MFNKISSSQEQDISLTTFLLFLICSVLGEYYIGLNKVHGTYKWADGTAASFINWNTGFPKGPNGVVMMLNGNLDNGKWQNRNHNDALRFICECPEGPCA